jgi:hypothetical protein
MSTRTTLKATAFGAALVATLGILAGALLLVGNPSADGPQTAESPTTGASIVPPLPSDASNMTGGKAGTPSFFLAACRAGSASLVLQSGGPVWANWFAARGDGNRSLALASGNGSAEIWAGGVLRASGEPCGAGIELDWADGSFLEVLS